MPLAWSDQSPAPRKRDTPRVSILVPCRDEEGYIASCLDSILTTDYPRDRLEILVIDGRSRDGTRTIVERYAREHAGVRLLDNPRLVVPAALNRGIRAARGDVIIRMDAHVVYPPDYIPRLVAALVASGAENVGGCIVTLPADHSPAARAVAIALAHPFGVGNSWFRIGVREPRWVDTVPFGCWRREVFDRVGLFDEELVRNQDDEFNHRLARHGGRVLLAPDVVSYYYARPSLRPLGRMYYQYGCFKPLVAAKVGRVMTLRQLVPPAFVLALALLPLLALAWPPAALLAGLVACSYGLAVLLAAAPVAVTHGSRCALMLALAFPVVHVSYGAGFLRGLARLLGRGTRIEAATLPLSR